MIEYRTFYAFKTFENVKKYLFSTYPSQPKTMSIVSEYCFLSSENGRKELSNIHILEISKKDGIRLRLLPNERSIGGWATIDSMIVQGIDYNSLIIGTKRNNVKIIRSDLMTPDKQTIKMYDFPDIDGLPP